MGLFDKLGKAFEKKNCDICGNEIKLLGNRKLEDGNLCKECASKLSPWFSERRKSTVEDIRAQLEYREANKAQVDAFHTTRSIGRDYMVLLDEDNRKFIVAKSKDIRSGNPDVLDFSQVTGCDLDIDESRTEEKRKNAQGEMVSYNPPRYTYRYDFYINLRVNSPWFDTMRFKINPSSVRIDPNAQTMSRPMTANRVNTNTAAGVAGAAINFLNTMAASTAGAGAGYNPALYGEYQQYVDMGNEIKEAILQVRQEVRDQINAANAPKMAVTCPYCGASTIPDANGCCEFCGGAVNG